MESYIIRIYRRDPKYQPLAGIIERVGERNSFASHAFNDREQLWAQLSLPEKPDD